MSTVDDLERALMAELLRGDLAPGTRLRQDEVARRYDVSTIPVREALHRLAATGLLRFEANRGVVVPRLTSADAEETYALRRSVEPLLLAQAVPRLSIVDLAAAEHALTAPTASVAAANWAFHGPLYAASGWERGLAIAEALHAAVAPYVALYTDELAGDAASAAEHGALLEACRRGDASTAIDVLAEHLARAEDALVAFLQRAP